MVWYKQHTHTLHNCSFHECNYFESFHVKWHLIRFDSREHAHCKFKMRLWKMKHEMSAIFFFSLLTICRRSCCYLSSLAHRLVKLNLKYFLPHFYERNSKTNSISIFHHPIANEWILMRGHIKNGSVNMRKCILLNEKLISVFFFSFTRYDKILCTSHTWHCILFHFG